MTKVSVLMPAYNASSYIAEAIESVLNQSYQDFELIIIDDGSTDATREIIDSYAHDTRIICFQNERNEGLVSVRNRAIKIANGEYLAWLDSDDVSTPSRLERQVRFLDENPKIGVCGTWVRTKGLPREEYWRYPESPNVAKCRLLFDDPIATSSCILRKSILDQSSSEFDSRYPPAEDYDLWERLSQVTDLSNIPEFLTVYRVHTQQISRLKSEQQIAAVWQIQCRQLNSLGINPTDDEKELHLNIGVGWGFNKHSSMLSKLEQWLLKLKYANQRLNYYPEREFSEVLRDRWYLAAITCIDTSASTWKRFSSSVLVDNSFKKYKYTLRIISKSLFGF